MDAVVARLLNGPKSADPAERLDWVRKVHDACGQAPEKAIQRIAQPLARAAELLARHQGGSPKELDEAEPHIAGLLLQAQGLAIYAYLEELGKMRNAVAAEAAKAKPGSDNQNKAKTLQAAYEQTIDGLARAYNGLRQAKFEEVAAAREVIEKAQKSVEPLRM